MVSLKQAVIEYIDYNLLLSLMDFFDTELADKKVHDKNISVVQSYSDINIEYVSPSLSIEVLNRKNRSLGFSNYIGDVDIDDGILEFEGVNFEYRVQLNVYSNTRGGNHKWSSLVDEALAKGNSGIPLNTYHDNGNIKDETIGYISYDYSSDVKNNNQIPNINTYDFHTIFEVKMNAIQLYKTTYGIMKLDIEGTKKDN